MGGVWRSGRVFGRALVSLRQQQARAHSRSLPHRPPRCHPRPPHQDQLPDAEDEEEDAKEAYDKACKGGAAAAGDDGAAKAAPKGDGSDPYGFAKASSAAPAPAPAAAAGDYKSAAAAEDDFM